jgi:hypothetical protein
MTQTAASSAVMPAAETKSGLWLPAPVNLDRPGAGIPRLGNADHRTIDCFVEMGAEASLAAPQFNVAVDDDEFRIGPLCQDTDKARQFTPVEGPGFVRGDVREQLGRGMHPGRRRPATEPEPRGHGAVVPVIDVQADDQWIIVHAELTRRT